MNTRRAVRLAAAPLAVAAGVAAATLPSAASGGEHASTAGAEPTTFRVTVVNGTFGQPFSPPVAATHRASVDPLLDGRWASPELAAIAQAGDQSGAVEAFQAGLGDKVTDVVDVGQPLTPTGVQDGPFPSAVTFDIDGARGDRLSFATMLICTNDGFTGLDGVKLPKAGTKVYPLADYDAGVERNTEASSDIVDACSALGPVTLVGDDNGNIDDGDVLEAPQRTVRNHRGVNGTVGDLLPAHDWGKGPVGSVTITALP